MAVVLQVVGVTESVDEVFPHAEALVLLAGQIAPKSAHPPIRLSGRAHLYM